MINLAFTIGLAIPIAYVFFNVALFGIFKTFKAQIANTLAEITEDWLKFMKRGIPIPTADYEGFEGRFTGEPVLIRPVFHLEETKPLVK